SYPGVTWVTGMAIASRLQHSEQQVLDKVPYFTVVKRDYHLGVYRSTLVTTYAFRNPALQALKIGGAGGLPSTATFTVESNIQHGPFPGLHTVALAVVDSTIELPPALQQELSGVIGSKPLLKFHTTLDLFGGATSDLTSPAFSLRLADGSNLVWGGLTGTLTASRNQVRWSARLSAPHLLAQGAQGGFELTGAEYSGSHEKALDGLYAGTGTFTIERMDGSAPRPGADFSMQRISLTSTSKADGEFLDMRVDVAMDAAKIAAVQLTNVMYSESFEHLYGPSLASLADAIRTAQRQAGGDPQQLRAGMSDAFRQYGIDLVLHDPVLNIRQVSFTMPEGSLLLSARISAPGLGRGDLQQWPGAIMALRAHAAATADLRVDNGLLQKLLAMGGSNPKVAAQLTSFEQQGYLTAGPTAVTTHLELSGGSITLNGHPFPPAPPVN
ncbi:MAG TPA: YdgA family protein, partial [Steroidobacteraceae bacterium]|nr:YdgA family protein [Steroidobacteraceae bacterium]